LDLTGSGDSWQINDGLDNVLSGPVEPCTELYAGSHDRREPYVSPLFGDLTGFPPVILLTGTRDKLLSDNHRGLAYCSPLETTFLRSIPGAPPAECVESAGIERVSKGDGRYPINSA
jgi:hypothetical protein